jgi:hypothetical protein
MAPPNSFKLPANIYIEQLQAGEIRLSRTLINLLVQHRSKYEWPSGIGKKDSQRKILELENFVSDSMEDLDLDKAHSIVKDISKWGGNNKKSQLKIESASPLIQQSMVIAIENFNSPVAIKDSLNRLSDLPGIRLVIATKIFRFCNQILGASLDRHSSYFFNSLSICKGNGTEKKTTVFKREWTTKKHSTSRLAIYSSNYHRANLNEYMDNYIPLLKSIADNLNSRGIQYSCAATGENKNWRPTDVEMAAYFYCAKGEHR